MSINYHDGHDWKDAYKRPPLRRPVDGGSSGSAVNANWAQNDESAADYIKNRPFYDKQETLISEQTLTFADLGMGIPMALPSGINIDAASDYVIEFDGVKYTGTSFADNDGIYFGNKSLDFSSGDPFLIGYSKGNGWMAFASTAGDHTVILRAMVPIKIPARYIPEQQDLFFTSLGSYSLTQTLEGTSIGNVSVYNMTTPEYLFDTTSGRCKYCLGINGCFMYLNYSGNKFAIFNALTGLTQREDGSVIEKLYAYVYDDEGLTNLKSAIGVTE